MQQEHDHLVLRICGDSGDGIQLIGDQLMMNAAMSGLAVRTLPDYPAEIRAPAGTVSGISGIQLALSSHQIETAGDKVNVLVAFNPAALVHSLKDLSPNAFIIMNECQFSEKDWLKAKASPTILQELSEKYQLLSMPFIKATVTALADLELKQTQAKRCKNFFVLGSLVWLLELSIDKSKSLIEKKFTKDQSLSEANQLALMAGFHYAMTQDWQRPYFLSTHPENVEAGEFRQINGAEAVGLALATLATMLKRNVFVSGYPITPSSVILHECARLADYGIDLLQAEDEIAAICACLGAAFGGHLALTTTSGPGFDLKMEGLGLGVVSELPLVVIDVQRAGASTGLPTKTSQADLRQALYGRHGESPMPVIAAKSPGDCFYTIIEAFRIAVDMMTPVVVLLDAYLMNASEPWRIPDISQLKLPNIRFYQTKEPFKRLANGSRSWNPPGDMNYVHQLGGLEKQGDYGKVSYDADNHELMTNIRAEKLNQIQQMIMVDDIVQIDQSCGLLISWGSTYGMMKTVIEQLHQQGQHLSWIHLRHLSPLPKELASFIKPFKKVLVFELNSGHLCDLVRANFLVDAKSIHQCNGKPFSSEWIIDNIRQHIL
jgi:2-oxoglutarate ferredoxin oxidoreductase subunit alpha